MSECERQIFSLLTCAKGELAPSRNQPADNECSSRTGRQLGRRPAVKVSADHCRQAQRQLGGRTTADTPSIGWVSKSLLTTAYTPSVGWVSKSLLTTADTPSVGWVSKSLLTTADMPFCQHLEWEKVRIITLSLVHVQCETGEEISEPEEWELEVVRLIQSYSLLLCQKSSELKLFNTKEILMCDLYQCIVHL